MHLYFRALGTPDHFKSFKRGDVFSCHASISGDWIQIWNNTRSQEPEDYPLNSVDGPYTTNARDAFIRIAPRYGATDIWNNEDLQAASQLHGLCTFKFAQDALNYGINSFFGLTNDEVYLIYSGIENGNCAEEDSVLLIDPNLVDGPLNRSDFMIRYNLLHFNQLNNE